jgi:tetratricopeptide (TPR) repeat protein
VERAAHDAPDEATTLHDIGACYWATGQPDKAIDFYSQARVLQDEVSDKPDEAATFNDLGNAYASLGEPQKALANFDQALPIERETGNIEFEAITLHSAAKVYEDIAQPAKALERYEQALVLEHKVGNHRAETTTFNNIGAVYLDLNKPQQAMQFYTEALAAAHTDKNLRVQSIALHNIGRLYLQSGKQREARDALTQALVLELQTDDRPSEAVTRWRLASLDAQPLDGFLDALRLAQTAGDPDLSGRIQTSLMLYYRDHGSVATAIYFGKEAVNNFQKVRGNLQSLGKASQDTFVESRGDSYRELARLLFQEGRFPEAEQVVDLLKKQEYAEFMRGDEMVGSAAPLPMTPAESMISSITATEMRWLTLKSLKTARTPEQQAEYLALDAKLAASNRTFSEQIQDVLKVGNGQKNVMGETSGLQNILRQLGRRSPDTTVPIPGALFQARCPQD